MGIVIDFTKAKKAQMKEVQQALERSKADDNLVKKVRRNRAKYKELKSHNPKLERVYQVDKNTKVTLYEGGSYKIERSYSIE